MRVAALARYPVKSMLGEVPQACAVTDRGLVGDRGYAVVDAEDGTVASAKRPRRWGALLGVRAVYVTEPVAGEPLPPVDLSLPDGAVLRSDDAAAVDGALSALLDRPVRLTREVPAGGRYEEQWPAIDGLAPAEFIAATTTGTQDGEPVSAIDLGMLAPPGTFFDLAPLHLLTTSTLRALSERAPGPTFDARRYRPNVLVDGAPDGFAEDGWVGRALGLGPVQASVAMAAMRCVMTTLAQDGLPEDRDTLRAIAREHRVEIPGLGTWACAGVYATVGTGGVLRVGDEVRAG